MPACHAGGRGFESPHGRHMGQYSVTGSGADCKSVALGSVGSSPTWPTKCLVSSDGRAVPSYGKGRRFDACTRHHYGVLDKRLSPWPFKPESPVRIRYTSPCGRSSNGRAPGCGPGGCGFEFRRSPQIPSPPPYRYSGTTFLTEFIVLRTVYREKFSGLKVALPFNMFR